MRYNKYFWIIISIILLLILGLTVFPKKEYQAADFNIDIVTTIDCNQNGKDDYTDILLGARKDAIDMVKYKSAYYSGGYPPDNEGVCTDLVWRSFKNAGYLLKDMVDSDIRNSDYYQIKDIDANIDFRRVENLRIYFQNKQLVLTTDINDIATWQPGDIVTFSKKHIGIISDKRNKKGIPYLIHNSGQLFKREENVLEKWYKKYGISGHYRLNNISCNKSAN